MTAAEALQLLSQARRLLAGFASPVSVRVTTGKELEAARQRQGHGNNAL